MAELLPLLYQPWIDELLPGGIPDESRATCSACTMLDSGDATAPDVPFLPQVKCCTYYPELSNFHVGRVLADRRPEMFGARRILEERIKARIAVTPLYIAPPPVYQALYTDSALAGPFAFGRSPALRCPHFVELKGQCGMWPHRNAVCSTFFCKYVRGPRGRAFWRVLQALLVTLEQSIRSWCVDKLDPSGDLSAAVWVAEAQKPKALDDQALAGTTRPALYARVWGAWIGREVDFYGKCAELVGPLALADVLAIGGAPATAAARAVVALHRDLGRSELPPAVARGTHALVQIGRAPGTVRVRHVSAPHDYVDLPSATLDAATRLAGRPLAEALAAENVSEATVRTLLDFDVLTPAG